MNKAASRIHPEEIAEKNRRRLRGIHNVLNAALTNDFEALPTTESASDLLIIFSNVMIGHFEQLSDCKILLNTDGTERVDMDGMKAEGKRVLARFGLLDLRHAKKAEMLANGYEHWLIRDLQYHESKRCLADWSPPEFDVFLKHPDAAKCVLLGPPAADDSLIPVGELWERDCVTLKTAAYMLGCSARYLRKLVEKRDLRRVERAGGKMITGLSLRQFRQKRDS